MIYDSGAKHRSDIAPTMPPVGEGCWCCVVRRVDEIRFVMQAGRERDTSDE